MINLMIAYDDEDLDRGEYFTYSKDHLSYKIQAQLPHINSIHIDTVACELHTIDHYIQQLRENPFIFISYTHGNIDALLVGDIPYINIQNSYFFSNTLFYAVACLSAKELGVALIHHNCKIFVGYKEPISSVKNETEPVFRECENAFIAHFLTTTNTIKQCKEFLYDKYQEMIVHLSLNNCIIDAEVLEKNLDAFEILCLEEDYGLTKEYFNL